MDEARQMVGAFVANETTHLKVITRIADARIESNILFISVAGISALFLILFTTAFSILHSRRRKLAEQDLILSNEALIKTKDFSDLVFGSSRDCIKVLDLDCHLHFMNVGGQRLLEICDFGTVKGAN